MAIWLDLCVGHGDRMLRLDIIPYSHGCMDTWTWRHTLYLYMAHMEHSLSHIRVAIVLLALLVSHARVFSLALATDVPRVSD